MGLDITHYKLTMVPQDSMGTFHIDVWYNGWEEKHIPYSYFEKYITDIPFTEYTSTDIKIEIKEGRSFFITTS